MHTVVQNLDQFNAFFHQQTYHPLVGVGDLSKADLSLFEPTDFGCYCVVLMDVSFGELVKGGRSVRYGAHTMFTIRPGEVVSMNLDPSVKPRGKMLVMRPEMVGNTGLGRDFYLFNYFDNDIFEALTLSESERLCVLNCYANLDAELHTENDELTGHMLRLGIGQLMSFCKRFFDRQFDTKSLQSSEFIKKLESLVDSYFSEGSDLPRNYGVPTVAWCSAQFHLAPNYFGNIVRRNIHISAQEYLHRKITSRAQQLLLSGQYSVDQVADMLGFAYSNHFSRFFRKRTGVSPTAFRKAGVVEN